MAEARRRLKMMWDYTAFPLWAVVSPEDDAWWTVDELPLSEVLRRELQVWSDEWTDAMWGPHGPDAPGWRGPSREHRVEWDRRGRELLLAVKQQLGSDYAVGYFNEETGEVEWPSG